MTGASPAGPGAQTPEGGEPEFKLTDFDAGEVWTGPYDPEPDRERVRGRMAFTLIALFAFEVVFLLAAVAAGWLTVPDAETLGSIVSAPTVGLAGAATGFYYATRRG